MFKKLVMNFLKKSVMYAIDFSLPINLTKTKMEEIIEPSEDLPVANVEKSLMEYPSQHQKKENGKNPNLNLSLSNVQYAKK